MFGKFVQVGVLFDFCGWPHNVSPTTENTELHYIYSIPALNAWAAPALYTTECTIITQFPGHACMDDCISVCSFDSQATKTGGDFRSTGAGNKCLYCTRKQSAESAGYGGSWRLVYSLVNQYVKSLDSCIKLPDFLTCRTIETIADVA